MNKTAFILLVLVLFLTACRPSQSVSVAVPEPASWPTANWLESTPEAQGMDSTLLAQMIQDLSSNESNIYSVLVVRNGALITEAYFHPYTRDTNVHVQSITKSVIGMLVGKALSMGAIESVDENLMDFFPNRSFHNPSEEKNALQLSHLLSMSSGLDCQEFTGAGPTMEQSANWVQFMLDLPVVETPGEKFGYCNGNAHLLSAILEQTTGLTARELANQELFKPLGISPVEEVDWAADPLGHTIGGYGLHLRPLDLAKLALLFLQNGKWEGQQLLPASFAAAATTQQVAKEDGSGYGYLWTVYPDREQYAALGLGGQQIHVFPSKNLIVVVTAGLESFAEAPEIAEMLSEYILPAVKSGDPLPENAAGMAELQSAIEKAWNPVQEVADLPAAALDISGSKYTLEENPLSWQTFEFYFQEGAETASLRLNGSEPIAIGLDNLFRLSNVQPFGEILLRGRWVDEQTFTVDYPYSLIGLPRLGELGDVDIQFQFSGDDLEITVDEQIFGGEPFTLSGSR
jgi:CubicO group peptidase (beta-lactamase class C family)